MNGSNVCNGCANTKKETSSLEIRFKNTLFIEKRILNVNYFKISVLFVFLRFYLIFSKKVFPYVAKEKRLKTYFPVKFV